MPTFFLSYVTANDDPGYAVDFANFRNMVRRDPGVPRIEMYIAVSEAVPRSRSDERIVSRLERRLGASPIISVENIAFKSNVGRDFSSAAYNLRLIARMAGDDDFILFLNRSAYGPLSGGWYHRYVVQYMKYPNAQLCGSTINFCGHPDLPPRHQTTHVQTYAFMGTVGDFREFLDDFPGEQETERLGVIDAGEIGLSGRILNRGGALTCLAWPEYVFDKNEPTSAELPHRDIKEEVRGLPFQYRARVYTVDWWRTLPALALRIKQFLQKQINRYRT
jgi:hypothetical protein